jgi:hypothetical protein
MAAIAFGYLIGVLLRLVRADPIDSLSAWWLKTFSSKIRDKNGELKRWVTNEFPYIGWIEDVCNKYLPPENFSFYKEVWEKRGNNKKNKQFFNYCKMLINSEDERCASEIYADEAFTRYIAEMFCALAVSTILLLPTTLIKAIYDPIWYVLFIILILYITSMALILKNFRTIRIKEVENVFAATFKLRDKLFPKDSQKQWLNNY